MLDLHRKSNKILHGDKIDLIDIKCSPKHFYEIKICYREKDWIGYELDEESPRWTIRSFREKSN